MVLYVRIFVVDPVVRFFLLVFDFFFLFDLFLILVCWIFEGRHFANGFFIFTFCGINILILFFL